MLIGKRLAELVTILAVRICFGTAATEATGNLINCTAITNAE